MEPLSNLIVGAITVTVSAIVAVYVGRRRGLDQVDARADSEMRKLIDAQAARLTLLEAENVSLKTQVATLTAQVATLTSDLHRSDAALRMAMSAGRDDGR